MEEEAFKSRRFLLVLSEDESGVSGMGVVAEGVQFQSGRVVMEWRVAPYSIGIYGSVEEVIGVHGHGGKTRLIPNI